jgi:hypothetical protein
MITVEDIMKMDLVQIEKIENQIWTTPNPEHGKAQIPYLYDKQTNEILNACVRRRQQLMGS